MAGTKRKSRDLRTEVLESATSNLRASVQGKRPRLSALLSDNDRSRESTVSSVTDFASTQFEPSGNILQNYTDARDDNPELDSDEDAERMDEENEVYMREKQRNANVQNQAADCGILQSVTCQNFMCHRMLHVDFEPLINFIIGHNGSGKSAVLTAITLCLGGKATSTNRGQSLKSFVREGADAAVLTVKIKNHGTAAFKRDLYGDTIIVERHFNTSGTSGFKIKSKDNRIISTKRMELDDITDFFGLLLDNPLTVLTQDQARQFLNNSSNADKYRFFMKGVQLEQLDNDYSVFGSELDSAEEALTTVKEDCKVLKERYVKAQKKKDLSEKSDSVRTKINSYRRQAAWVQVEEQEYELERAERAIEEQRQRVQEAEEAFHNTEAQFDQADQVVNEAEREHQSLQQDKQPLEESHREAKEKFEAVSQELKDANHTCREIKDNLDSERNSLKHTEKSLDDEYRRLSDRSDGRENEKRDEIRNTEEALADVCQQGREHDQTLPQLEERIQVANDKAKTADSQQRGKYDVVEEAQKQLGNLRKDNRDPLAAFHPSMKSALRALDQDNGFSVKPIGPLAFHVRNKQPKWQSMIEKTFGNLLDNFIVTSRQDQKRLSDLLARCKCNSNVLVARPDFRITSLNEPDSRFNTILRALEIDNGIVRDQLVITTSIEQTILVDTQDEAIRLSEHGLPTHCKAIMCPHPHQRNRGFRYQQGRGGSQRQEPVDPWTRPFRMKTDNQAAIRAQEETVNALKDELYEAEQHKRECQEAAKAASQALQQHKRRKRELQLETQQTEDRVAELKGELEAMQPQDGALDGLKQQLEEHKEQIEHLRQQLDAATQEKEDVALQNRNNNHALDKATEQLKTRDDAITTAEKKLEKYRSARLRALKEKNEADHVRHDCEADVQRAEHDRDGQQQHVETYTEQAQQISSRIPVEAGMNYDKITERMQKLTEELKRQEQQVGGDKEAISWAHMEAKKKLFQAEKDFESTCDLVKDLTMTLRDRTLVWKHFRQHISCRARLEFHALMEARGFVGHMRIDHVHKTLELDVNPDSKRTGNFAGRQTKTLSGGEKSFSTVCMLLSLWEAMGSPIRCLDEFDVFMDSVNRDQSMRMMIESARQSVGKQFILITPQSMGGVKYGNDVKINRLADPERGQTTLNLPGA